MKNMKSVLYSIVVVLLATALINCGGTKKTAQAPTDLIKSYIAKHETMVDSSLVNLYIKAEQDKMTNLINDTIAAKKEEGSLDALQHATFDLSGLQIEILGEAEDYVNDEITQFMKVAVKGSYTIDLDGSAQAMTANETIILEKEGGAWKITETLNPWT